MVFSISEGCDKPPDTAIAIPKRVRRTWAVPSRGILKECLLRYGRLTGSYVSLVPVRGPITMGSRLRIEVHQPLSSAMKAIT